jgi:two-component sensor histidine kinase
MLSLALVNCGNKKQMNVHSTANVNTKILSDSLERLDSLINKIKTTNHSKTLIYSNKALSLAYRIHSDEALSKAFLLKGISYFKYENDSSYFYYSEALKTADRSGLMKIKPDLYYALAMFYRDANDNKMAAVYLDSSIYSARFIRDYHTISTAFNALGNLKYDVSDTMNSRRMYDSAYKIAIEYDLSKEKGTAIASLARFEKDINEGNELRKKAIAILKSKQGNEEQIASVLVNLGLKTVLPDTAIKYFTTSIQLAHSGNFSEIEIAAYNGLAYSYLDKHEPNKSEACLINYAIPLAEKTENLRWLSILYDSYSDVLKAKNDIIKALDYEHKALKIRTNADKQKAAEQVRLLSALLDAKGQELKIQNNEKELQKKESRIEMIIFSFSVLFLFAILIFLLIVWKLQRKRIKDQKLLIESGKKLISLEENLKGKVSMELHALVTPFYNLMWETIDKIRFTDPSVKMKLHDDLSIMSGKLRKISHLLDNSYIEKRTIDDLISSYCQDLLPYSPVKIHFNAIGIDFQLSNEQKIHVYRIIQELLANAIKYVAPGKVNLSISKVESSFFIFYEDDGPGFIFNEKKENGLGLMNIMERARIIDGRATLTSEPGKGTKWRIVIPIEIPGGKKNRIL